MTGDDWAIICGGIAMAFLLLAFFAAGSREGRK